MSARRFIAVLSLVIGTSPGWAADLPGRIVVKEPIATANPCGDPNVLSRIEQRFAWAERNTWHRGFTIEELQNARVSNHTFYEPGLIQRHYCMAESRMTDGTTRTAYYAIEIGQGFASIGNYVDFCVQGLDPWHVHDEACRTVR